MRIAPLLMLLAACDSPRGDAAVDAPRSPDGSTVRTELQICTGRAYVPAPVEPWRHDLQTPIITAAGDPNHAGKDVVAQPGTLPSLSGKFTYGTISKDLEDEDILAFIDDCTGWVSLGRVATDSDGRMSVALATSLPTGVYEVRLQVAGDQSVTTSFLWMLPAGTRAVLTDIDATLTTNDSQVFQQILDGSFVPQTYPNAVELMKAHERLGHIIVYMTGRPYWLSGKTRDYLAGTGFPPGPLRVADSNTDILPTEGSVGAYKLGSIDAFEAGGMSFDFAYGNATTDIFAYLGAGIAADRVWIIGDHAGEQGTHAIVGDWAPRVAEVNALPAVAQPFDR